MRAVLFLALWGVAGAAQPFVAALTEAVLRRQAPDGAWRGALGEDLTGLVLAALPRRGVPREAREAAQRHLQTLWARGRLMRHPLAAAGFLAVLRAAPGKHGPPSPWRAALRGSEPRIPAAVGAAARVLAGEPCPAGLLRRAGVEPWVVRLLGPEAAALPGAPPAVHPFGQDVHLDALRGEAVLRLPPAWRAPWRRALYAYLAGLAPKALRRLPTAELALYLRLWRRLDAAAPLLRLERQGGFAGGREVLTLMRGGRWRREGEGRGAQGRLGGAARRRLERLVEALLASGKVRPDRPLVLPGTTPPGRGADLRPFRLTLWGSAGQRGIVLGDDGARPSGLVATLLRLLRSVP